MLAEILIGVGTALAQGWNGVPVLCLGVPMSAEISTRALSRNMQAVSTVCNGSKIEVNGWTVLPNPLQE